MKLKIIIILLTLCSLSPCLWGGENGEKEKIINVVQQFFDILASKDGSKANKIIMLEGFAISVREKEGKKIITHRGFDTFAEEISKTKAAFKEVITNPKVMIHKEIAVLCAPYEFFIDGKFSHKGVDAFSLVKTEEGWKIASVVYTVEPDPH